MAYYLDWALDSEAELERLLPRRGVRHVFLIRHPQRAVRSMYLKSAVDNEATGWTYFDPREATFVPLHALWKRVCERGELPVVIDSDDVLSAPSAMMAAF